MAKAKPTSQPLDALAAASAMDEAPDTAAALAVLDPPAPAATDATPAPAGDAPLAAMDIPAPTAPRADRPKGHATPTETDPAARRAPSSTPPTPEKRGPGRPRGVTAKSYKTVKSKEALRELLRERDKQLAALEARAAAVAVNDAGSLARGMGMVLDFAFSGLAQVRGPHWKMPPQKRDDISKPLAEALAPYLKEHADKVPAAIAAAGIGSHVLAALAEDRKLAQSRGQGAPATGEAARA